MIHPWGCLSALPKFSTVQVLLTVNGADNYQSFYLKMHLFIISLMIFKFMKEPKLKKKYKQTKTNILSLKINFKEISRIKFAKYYFFFFLSPAKSLL